MALDKKIYITKVEDFMTQPDNENQLKSPVVSLIDSLVLYTVWEALCCAQ